MKKVNDEPDVWHRCRKCGKRIGMKGFDCDEKWCSECVWKKYGKPTLSTLATLPTTKVNE